MTKLWRLISPAGSECAGWNDDASDGMSDNDVDRDDVDDDDDDDDDDNDSLLSESDVCIEVC